MKERLAEKISKITNKKDIISIFKIIYENNTSIISNITENNNGLHMFFHNLSDITYEKLHKKIKSINKKRKYFIDSDSCNTDEYKPYSNDEFPSQKGIKPKLKFSNKEKNILNKIKYNHIINDDSNSNIIYERIDNSSMNKYSTPDR
jgi:hypothetical protein